MVTPDLISEEDIAKLIISDDLPDEPMLKAYIEAKVYDKEGYVIQYHRQPMRSLTQYFLALMSIPIIGTYQGPSTNKAVGPLTNTLSLPTIVGAYGVGSANISWNFSILLGSGTQAFSPTLTSLAAPIANGTGAGQLSYGSVLATYSGTTIYIYVTVINYSSTTINVREIGLSATVYIQYNASGNNYASSTYSYLISYDTLSQPITLLPGAMATFKVALTFSG